MCVATATRPSGSEGGGGGAGEGEGGGDEAIAITAGGGEGDGGLGAGLVVTCTAASFMEPGVTVAIPRRGPRESASALLNGGAFNEAATLCALAASAA